jgi:hypothetical protein
VRESGPVTGTYQAEGQRPVWRCGRGGRGRYESSVSKRGASGRNVISHPTNHARNSACRKQRPPTARWLMRPQSASALRAAPRRPTPGYCTTAPRFRGNARFLAGQQRRERSRVSAGTRLLAGQQRRERSRVSAETRVLAWRRPGRSWLPGAVMAAAKHSTAFPRERVSAGTRACWASHIVGARVYYQTHDRIS